MYRLLLILLDLIIHPSQQFFSYVGTGIPGLKQGLMCLAQGHNTVMLVRLEPTTPLSRVKHSTTEPLHSLGCFGAIYNLSLHLRIGAYAPLSAHAVVLYWLFTLYMDFLLR